MSNLKESELRYRRLFEAAQDGVLILDAVTGRIEDVNPFLIDMLGYTREELVEKTLWEVGPFKDIQASLYAFEALQENEYIRYENLPLKSKSGKLIQVEFVSNVYTVGSEKVIQCNIRDITARKQAEAKLLSAGEFLQSVQDALSAQIAILDHDTNIIQVNSAWRNFGEKNGLSAPNHCIGMNYLDVCESAKGPHGEEALLVAKALREMRNGGKEEIRVEYPCHSGNEKRWYVARITSFTNNQKMWIVVAHENITERKRAEERIQRQLEHLTALSTVDRVIAANFDIKLSLFEILTQVTTELGIDAADILLLNPNSQILEFGAERGFRTKSVRKAHVRLGESYAGQAALERKLVQIPDLRKEPDSIFLKTHFAGENFVCYYGVPLITKGQVKGVLEVLHREALKPDEEWLEFLQSLAGQTALAIENATLFESLQRSNSELTLAYDATIEGWSRALDLRDKETEGHTQRVTEMSMKLARAFGFNDADLVQIRWGALLHDIGKMGVPDEILLKPDQLTKEEWVKMKNHPVSAYEMLSPIRYLRLALDIPYCHHEKWDGSGYPHGLKGIQIPLAARIFSVVDVWDALKSDRPYRAAWSVEKIREYILAESGTHFDPQVVDVFMQISDNA